VLKVREKKEQWMKARGKDALRREKLGKAKSGFERSNVMSVRLAVKELSEVT